MSDEKINFIKTSSQSITLSLEYYGTKTIVRFNGSCLKQDKVTFNHGKILNIYIVYELSMFPVENFFMLESCLFGEVNLTKNLILISISILNMELDLIDLEVFHILVLDQAET